MLVRITLAVLLFSNISAFAEVRPYVNANIGIADSDVDNSVHLEIGGGVQFSHIVEFEVAYNDYGDVGPFKIAVESLSYGLNLGGSVSENVRLYGIIGAENIRAEDTVDFDFIQIDIDESGTEGYVGIGLAFSKDEYVDIRTKLTSHDGGDIVSLSIGISAYF